MTARGRRRRLPLRASLAVTAGRLAATASRRLGRGAGDVIGGRVTLRLAPGALTPLIAGCRTVLVSGTNGKTTTTRFVSAAAASAGSVVTNGGGANMAPGILAALVGDRGAETAVLEVDELHLPGVARALTPDVVALLNLSRDQLDRSNETRRIAGLWRDLGADLPHTVVIANADDPLVVWAATGFAQVRWVHAGQVWTSDAMVCPRCAALLRREAAGPGGSAEWSCPRCGLARPAAHVGVAGADQLSLDGASRRVELQLPGRCNVANAAIALVAARELTVDDEAALLAMGGVSSVAGRYDTVEIAGRRARLLLAKNPAGWLEMLELLETAPTRPLVIDFNARTADGRDPSWIWDVPASRLRGRRVLVSGDRALDVVTRLRYAGVETQAFADVEHAVLAADGDDVDLLATYTAFRELVVRFGRTADATRIVARSAS